MHVDLFQGKTELDVALFILTSRETAGQELFLCLLHTCGTQELKSRWPAEPGNQSLFSGRQPQKSELPDAPAQEILVIWMGYKESTGMVCAGFQVLRRIRRFTVYPWIHHV